ncbi:leucyl aminopeptidase [Variovorax dokdonensis]|uniref:Probable cytosol aminopeptidase n=1 Tax=Variovorax dokdonensis TaxID=344883 RepID=A0ABT7NCI1_9BURK|nr:leucyl aminopeptidase [Variovorax dokdonensis]MDM0045560.1 leucyl aminopeptidase [Variovorax dokdonensis]
MNFQLKTLPLAQSASEKADALIVLVGEKPLVGKDPLSDLISAARSAGDLPDKAGKLLSLYHPVPQAPRCVVVASIADGKSGSIRSAVTAALAAARGAKPARVVLAFAQQADGAAVRAAVLAAADALYVYTTTTSKAEANPVRHLTIGVPDAESVKSEFDKAVGMVAGIEFAKEWGNRPANHCTPAMLADAAVGLAKGPKFKCDVLGPKEIAKLGMGAFAGVAQGSSEPARFIVLQYQGAAKGDAPVVLVGKGITFDTGGVSLKPAAEMDEMKFDMCGAASVLGVFRALGELRPAINVVGLVPACENMNDGKAIKPGDVLKSMSGQTVEVLNTDAEGRLILCDALTYAKRFSPAAVIDIATLTGACVIALGGLRSGLFSPDDQLASALQRAGESSLDRCWRMPLDDEYGEGLKSNFADMANIAGRAAGAVTAAKFLQKFTADFKWAHLDIAGTAWKSGAAKGATGRPVGLLMDFLLERAAQPVKAVATAKGAASKSAGAAGKAPRKARARA